MRNRLTGGAGQDAAPSDPPPQTNKMRHCYKRVAIRGPRYLRYLAHGTNTPHTTDADNVRSRVSMPYSILKLLISCICISSPYHVTNIIDQEL
jgi:hypothetical protein